jgi:hypothetical protein
VNCVFYISRVDTLPGCVRHQFRHHERARGCVHRAWKREACVLTPTTGHQQIVPTPENSEGHLQVIPKRGLNEVDLLPPHSVPPDAQETWLKRVV